MKYLVSRSDKEPSAELVKRVSGWLSRIRMVGGASKLPPDYRRPPQKETNDSKAQSYPE